MLFAELFVLKCARHTYFTIEPTEDKACCTVCFYYSLLLLL